MRAVGTSYLRKLDQEGLEAIGDNLLLIQGKEDVPLAVVVSYQTWLKIQESGNE